MKSFINVHQNFEQEDKIECKVNKTIREFAIFAKNNMPKHISSFTITVMRDGYLSYTTPSYEADNDSLDQLLIYEDEE